MEWLSAIWEKMNKPIHFFCVGIALLFFAPDDFNWVGWILIALGFAGFVEWISQKVAKYKDHLSRISLMGDTFQHLTEDKKERMRHHLSTEELTLYINYNDYHRFGERDRRGYIQTFGVCDGLRSKGLYMCSASNEEITSYTLRPEAWKILKALNEKKPGFLKSSTGA